MSTENEDPEHTKESLASQLKIAREVRRNMEKLWKAAIRKRDAKIRELEAEISRLKAR